VDISRNVATSAYDPAAVAGAVTTEMIRAAMRELGLAGLPLEVHSSLSSFGRVDGGAATVVDALLAEGCTVVVPTFTRSPSYLVDPPEAMRPERNGIDYDALDGRAGGEDRIFTPETNDVSSTMGAIPAEVLARPERVRGSNPLCSFAALGPLARRVREQRPLDVYAPLRILAAKGGWALLIGVDLRSLTLLHLAEEKAGRRLFRRWANGPDGKPMEVEVGSCSQGFLNFEPILAPLARETRVGESRWVVYPARELLVLAADAIRENPGITHCGDADCLRCRDAVAGGPPVSS
jgi:aminoglycoside 3-N-acetyltransferase